MKLFAEIIHVSCVYDKSCGKRLSHKLIGKKLCDKVICICYDILKMESYGNLKLFKIDRRRQEGSWQAPAISKVRVPLEILESDFVTSEASAIRASSF